VNQIFHESGESWDDLSLLSLYWTSTMPDVLSMRSDMPHRTMFAILLFLLLSTLSANAGNITADQATRAAENYLAFNMSVDQWDGSANATVQLERTLVHNDETIGYYFEINPDGWLLVPAYRELPPIKASAEHGRLDFDHPEGFGMILENVLRDKAATLARYPDLASMAEDGIDTEAVAHYGDLWDVFTQPERTEFFASLTENELDDYTPNTYMIQTVWHQGSPYNSYCPILDQYNCWVGCVATAVTQIMNYWQWPEHGIGGHSYMWENQTLSADFSDPYDWENILPVYGQPWDHTPEEIAAIAELSYEIGVSVEMNYGLDGSGILLADIDIVMTALRDYFGYQDIMDMEHRNAYATAAAWFAMLQAEINLERPMFYYISGHVIVCDGWRINNTINQIHINYGVGGSANSWYALDEIPGSDDPAVELVIRHIEPLATLPPVIEWQEEIISDNFDAASSICAADIDGDGDNDLIGAAYVGDQVAWWEDLNGDGTTWSEHTVAASFNGARSVHAADVDGDGDMDILGAASNGHDIAWWENVNGGGLIWAEHLVDGNCTGARSVFATDMDSDGDTDILGAAYDDDRITWWENLGGGGLNWAVHVVDWTVDGPKSVYATDIDNDGDADVIGAAYYAQDILWWENVNGAGTNWTEHAVDESFAGAGSVHAADIDGDGDTDLLGAGAVADEIRWYENVDGSGAIWSANTLGGAFDGASSVFATDIDGDGDTDILGAAYGADDVSWWENVNGDGTSWTKNRVGWMVDGVNCVYAADLGNDGDMDLLGAAYIADEITIWLQEGTGGPLDPVVVTITPAISPTIVPQGGWFEYDFLMNVNITQPALGYVWTMATLPNGQAYGPVFDVEFMFAPGMSLTVDGIQQNVVSFAPVGDYTWTVNAGPSLLNPIASDSFPFTVVAASAAVSENVNEWTSIGHEQILIAAGADPSNATDHTIPREYSISQAYPNPFNPTTTLSIDLPEASQLSVVVFNVTGQRIAELANGQFNAGSHHFTFDASGRASGLYFVRAIVPGQMDETQKVLLVR
jgi:Peptidase C10 family/FG-GAP-like repeat/Secretion system C-terminal sorting domain